MEMLGEDKFQDVLSTTVRSNFPSCPSKEFNMKQKADLTEYFL